MKRLPVYIFCLSLLLLGNVVHGQQNDIERELQFIKGVLDRAVILFQILPDVFDENSRTEIQLKLTEAQTAFQEARAFAQAGQVRRAQLLIAKIKLLLRQAENLLQNNRVLRIKYFEQVDLKIQQAEEKLRMQGNSDILMRRLTQAKFYRQKAQNLYRSNQNILASIEYLQLALSIAEHIIRENRQQDNARWDESRWTNFSYETRILYQKANSMAASSDNLQIRDLLRNAGRELENVQRLAERQDYLAAQAKLIMVNQGLHRAMDILEKIPRNEADRLLIDLASFEFTLTEIENNLGGRDAPAARAMVKRGKEAAINIRELIRRNRLEVAARRLSNANRIAMRLYRLSEVKTADNPQALQRQIQSARQHLETLRNNPSPAAYAVDLLALVEDNLNRAEAAYAQNRQLPASLQVRAANLLMLKYVRLQKQEASTSSAGENLQNELAELGALLSRLSDAADDDAQLAIRYHNAQKLYQMASDALRNENDFVCRELLQMAINLVTK